MVTWWMSLAIRSYLKELHEKRRVKILVVGAGIGGLTLACFLQSHKHFHVDIIEQQKDWSHIGYTIGIWDVGRQILAKLDLAEEFDHHARRIGAYYLQTTSNEVLKLYHFDDFYCTYETAYVHIGRKVLHDILRKRSRARIRMNTTIVRIEQKDIGVIVELSDGTKHTYDLVVGADGVHSRVRNLIFGSDVAYTGNRVWYAWISKQFCKPLSVIEIVDGSKICNIFDDPKQACVVLTAPTPPLSKDDPLTRLERLRHEFKNFELVQEILMTLKPEDLRPIDIAFVNTDDWVKQRVVLIGDAAHAMEPFAGIGASMAMEDGYVLAEELAEIAAPEDLQKTLMRYQHRRLGRISYARCQTRQRYWWITLRIPGLPLLRKTFCRIIPISHFTKGYKVLLDTKP
jgi:2-polyprenyl-6-methoxyphenol hydroxylase-like FAD-dependent oxidoreductase